MYGFTYRDHSVVCQNLFLASREFSNFGILSGKQLPQTIEVLIITLFYLLTYPMESFLVLEINLYLIHE